MNIKLNRINVGIRLAGAFVIICSLLLALWAVATIDAKSRDGAQKEINNASDVRVMALDTKYLSADFNGWQTGYAFDVLRGVPNATDDNTGSRKSFLASTKAFEKSLVSLQGKRLSQDEKQNIQSMQEHFAEFMKVDDQVIQLYRSSNGADKEKATSLVMNEEIALFESISKDVDAFVASAEKGVQSTEASASKMAQRNTKLLMTIVVISLILAVALAVLITRSIVRPLRRTMGALDEVANGDLTVTVDVDGTDEPSRMAMSLNRAVGNVRSIVETTTSTSHMVSAAAEELSVVSSEMSDQASMMAAATEEMSATIEEIARSTSNVANQSSVALDSANRSNENIEHLASAVGRIGQVVEVINTIAAQTNLLALNATIEAARAGDAGKGFAVVASEVKNLAQSTSTSTSEIETSVESVRDGAQQAIDGISGILHVVTEVSEIQTSISASITEQSATAGEIGRSAELTSSSAAETAKSAEELTRLASELQAIVSQFKVSSDGAVFGSSQDKTAQHMQQPRRLGVVEERALYEQLV